MIPVPVSTLILIGVVALLVVVYVIIAEILHRRDIRRATSTAWNSAEQRVAEEMARLRAELQTARNMSDRKTTQLSRCRETLRKVLGDIEVLG
jgi:hypothetical protein